MTRDFSNLNFQSFGRLAEDKTLSKYEKIGFPDTYRQGFEKAIFEDICGKLDLLGDREKTILDIGPGCSDLAHMLIEHCRHQNHRLILADCSQMLAHLPDEAFIDKVPGMFPDTAEQIRAIVPGGVDVILCYSVLQYLVVDTNAEDAMDVMVQLLKPGGEMLIGDIPNVSMRKRFFSSAQGIAYHKQFTKQNTLPDTEVLMPDSVKIDDKAILSLLGRIRASGADAYVVPQSSTLPMANRREDILIRKP